MRSSSVASRKRETRLQMRSRLAAMKPTARAAASRELVDRLAAHPALQTARIVLLYAALPSEPDLSALAARLPHASWAYPEPQLSPQRMTCRLVRCSGSELISSPLGPLQPDPTRCPLVDPSHLDVCIVPGLAFDESSKVRLGRGGGYFDRFLSFPGLRARKIGVGFRFQSVPGLPREPHDVLLDEVQLA